MHYNCVQIVYAETEQDQFNTLLKSFRESAKCRAHCQITVAIQYPEVAMQTNDSLSNHNDDAPGLKSPNNLWKIN